MGSTRFWIWVPPLILYAVFWLWYTPLSGPMTPEEIEAAVARVEQSNSDPAQMDRIRRFLEEDDGRPFVMINLLDTNEQPRELPATGPGAGAGDLLNHYMEYMYPALLSRASHPVFAGVSVAESLDLVGIEGAEVWDQAALMRYRSRRDMWAISNHPSFGDRHEYKMEALAKTIAFPVAPVLFLSDLRIILALAFLALAGLLDVFLVRRRS